MKVMIAYPPLESNKGYPTLGQNRQFQYFKAPTFIYPVVPASAATLLKQEGLDVFWLDCIAENISYARFIEIIKEEQPDLIVFESKTPVIKREWQIIDALKELSANHWQLRIGLFGDHVSALPQESFEHSGVDFILTGGDYDFLLLNLCRALKLGQGVNLEPGIYFRQDGQIRNTGHFKLNHDLNTLPFIDRELTKWKLYAYENGNYKRAPGTYIMSGRDCWWGRCTFCGWANFYPEFRARKASLVLDEIGALIERYAIREIMDDTGTFPVGEWLRSFCDGMIERGYSRKIYFDCNMRFGAISKQELSLMKKANFRLLLFGLESANQKTLDRIHKRLKVEDIIEGCRQARSAGLYPHITVMFGYPWETYEDALNTLRLAKWLLRKGYAYTMQATVVIPYPGTELFSECKKEGTLATHDWDDYDMKQPVMLSSVSAEKILALAQGMYRVSFQPEFILRKLFSLRDADDLRYYLRAAKKVVGHIFDFGG